MYYNEKHAKAVKQRGDNYQYIGTYKRNEKLISTGKILGVDIDKGHNKAYIRVTCGYCGNNYDVSTQGFNKGLKCPNCCHNYENSFAYYIQEELKEPLNKYKWEEGIDYFTQKTFLNLKGIKRELSYDFYFPKQKILLEYQGEFHDGTADIQNELDFIVQSKNDKKKFNYALEHDYIPMEIWYWDYDNIEEILIRELDLH